MIKFPNILISSPRREFVTDLVLSTDELSEFKDWLVDKLDVIDDINEEKVLESVKNTRFYDSFLVLSDPKKMYLDMSFVEKNQENLEQIFDLFSKKHYLLQLKQEYVNLMANTTEDSEHRAQFFLKEIQETVQEISKMNESLVG